MSNKLFQKFAIVLFLLGLSFGLKVSLRSMDGQVTTRMYVSERNVAGINQLTKKAAMLNPNMMNINHVIQAAQIGVNQERQTTITFGNFVDNQNNQDLCSMFDRMEVHLRSEGYAVSGEPVRLIFSGQCPGTDSRNPEHLNPFKLFNEEMCDGNIALPEVSEIYPDVLLTVANIDEEFPLDWAIDAVIFYYGTDKEGSYTFDEYKIRAQFNSQLIIASCPPIN